MNAKLLDGSATFRPTRFRKTAPNRPAFLAKAVALGLIALMGHAGSALAGVNGPFVAVRADHANLPTIVVADNMTVYTASGAATNLNWSGYITNLNAYGLVRVAYNPDTALVWSAVKYLRDGIYQMTGQRLPVVSHNTYPLTNAIMLTTLAALTNSPNAPADIVSKAKAALIDNLNDPYTKLYDRSEAFYIHTEANGIYIVANNFSGLGHAVVELLEGGHAAAGYQIGYETLSMGPNWTYTPNFTAKNLIFNMEYSDHPGFYLRLIAPEWGAASGVGTISYGILLKAGLTNGLPAPDEPVEISYDHWQRGFRIAAQGQGQSMPHLGSQGNYDSAKIVSNMVTTSSTNGFICRTGVGSYASRPAASSNNYGMLWLANNVPLTATNVVSWCIKSGANYVWYECTANGVRPHPDFSVPAVRALILDAKKKAAEAFWLNHPGQVYAMYTEPSDAGPGDQDFVKYTAYKNWYPDYRQAEGQTWGTYLLSGSPVGPVPNQPTESWWWKPSDPAHPDSANAYSDNLHGLNNWLLREFDKYVDSLPAANRLSGGISKKNLVITSCLSYYYHDVPPNFNLDRRVRVTPSFFYQHAGKGKWVNCAGYRDLMKAFSKVSLYPASFYLLFSQSIYSDWGVNKCLYGGRTAAFIQDFVHTPYVEAGCKGLVAQMDFNLGKTGLDYYLYSRMMWEPELTVAQLDALRTRWITRAYGTNAAGVMKQYYDYMVFGDFLNTPSYRGRAMNFIQQADALIASGTPEQRRLDDLKQFWYYYYLQDIGADASSQELKEFMWKGQMSYMNPLFTFLNWVFKDLSVYGTGHVVGNNYFNTNPPPFAAAAHYEPAETAGWWANVRARWPAVPVNLFDDAVLANGQQGSSVDINDLVGIRQFHTNLTQGYTCNSGYYFAHPMSRAYQAGDVIGFQIAWTATNPTPIKMSYSGSRWDAAHKQWTNTWSGEATSVFTNALTNGILRDIHLSNPEGKCQLIVKKFSAPVAGLYRFDIPTIYLPGVRVYMTTPDYDVASDTFSGASIPRGFTCGQNRREDAAVGNMYFYIPKGTTSLDLEVWAITGSHVIYLYKGLPGNGDWTPTRTIDISTLGTHRIPLEPGEAGSVARMIASDCAVQMFYSIPNLWATSPSLLMAPRGIVAADGLTPYTGAPAVLTQPSNQTVSAGQTARFTVAAAGSGTLTYQWRKNGASIAGATAAGYTTPAITGGDNGALFSVVVANAFGSAVSANAKLIVSNCPAIKVQPANQTVSLGALVTFSVTAGGDATLTYQWRKNGTNITGATASSYRTPATVAGDNGALFSVVVANALGSATSSNATLTVNSSAPVITVQPRTCAVNVGAKATFFVTATGLTPISYQWRRNGVNIAGATAYAYTTPATVTGDNGAVFSVVVSNSVGSVTSSNAVLTVLAAPLITAPPTNQAVTVGQKAVFSVTAQGQVTLKYQWQKNGANISGAIYASYTTPATVTGDNGATFRVVVSNALGSVASAAATLTVNAIPPTITAQPVSQTVMAEYQQATFSVKASGTEPLTYQWRRNGANIAGATAAIYTTPLTVYGDNGAIYSVVVANGAGSVTSANATLTVRPAPPAFTAQPTNLTVMAGQAATFRVTAFGTTPISYQWRKNGVNISGATSASYTTPLTVYGDNGAKYSVVAANVAGSATSADALLTVKSAPIVTAPPVNQTVVMGRPATFSVTVSGTPTFKYQWQKNGANIAGQVYTNYTTPATVAGDNGATFRVVVSNSLGRVVSAAATLTVANSAPVITVQPMNKSVAVGQAAAFSVKAVGTTPLMYQWQKNGVNIVNAKSWVYTLSAPTMGDNGATFRVVVSNTLGIVVSANATLTVTNSAPVITVQPLNKSVAVGQTAAFSVAAYGTTPLAYQWRRNGANISLATNTIYTLPAPAIGDNGALFSVLVTNFLGSALSTNARLTVTNAPPVITVQPANKTVTMGQPAGFSVTAYGTTPLKYQWRRNGVNIAGATAFCYTNPATVSGDSGAKYSVVVSNTLGTVTSTNALLTVNCPPAAPSGLAATAALSSRVNLSWTDNSTNESYFVLQRRIGTTNAFVTIAYPTAGTTSHADTTVAPLTSYTYRVCARNSYGDSAYTAEAAVTTPANVPPVVSLTGPANGAGFSAPASITLTATASDTDGAISRVYFYAGSKYLGQSAVAPYSLTWNNAPAGDYSLKAMAYDNRSAVTTSSVVTVHVTVSGGILPAGWSTYESVDVGINGSTSYLDGQFNISASGLGIGGVSDSFYFDYKSWTGNGQIVARVTSLQNTGAGAKAGVMMRASLDANAPCMFAGLTPSASMFSRRVATNGATTANSGGLATAPYWVKLVRYGNSVSGFSSSDGTTWVFLGTEIFEGLPDTLYVGLAATSGNNGVLATMTFDNVTLGVSPADSLPTVTLSSPQSGATIEAPGNVTLTANATADTVRGGQIIQAAFYRNGVLIGLDQNAPFAIEQDGIAVGNHTYCVRVTDDLGATVESAPVTVTVVANTSGDLPSGWTYQDIGAAPVAGLAGYASSDGKYTIASSGAPIGGTNDSFGFAWRSWSGDGQIVARVTSVQGAGAGVMMRGGLTAGAANAFMALTPSSALFYQRADDGEVATSASGGAVSAPYWVKLVRYGNSASGFRSADGTNWVFVGAAILDLPGSMNVGLAVASGNGELAAATFDHVAIGAVPADSLPTVSLSSPQSGANNTAPAGITLDAVAADPDGTVLRVAFYQDGVLAANDTLAPYSVTVNNVGVGEHVYFGLVTDNQGATVASAPLTITVAGESGGTLPGGWYDTNIGAGTGVGKALDGQFTVSGSGAGIGDTSDALHFTRISLTGNGQIVARITSWPTTSASGANCGLMMRDGLGANARMMAVNLNATVTMAASRTNAGATAMNVGSSARGIPSWLKLVRYGDTISAFRSGDGVTWTIVATEVYSGLPATLLAGIAVSSGDAGMAVATFDNVASGTIANLTAPGAAIASPANGDEFSSSDTVNIVSKASAAAGKTLARLALYKDGVLLRAVTANPYYDDYDWVRPTAGVYTLAALVTDSQGVTRMSVPIQIAVSSPVPIPPVISAQPENQTVLAGQTAVFSVTASGTAPISYQWRKNGTDIAGATSAGYTTPATVFGDDGAVYSVMVANVADSVESASATLTVNSAPAITVQPENQVALAGQAAVFSVTASGTAPLSYRWYKNGEAIEDATEGGYTTPAALLDDNGAVYSVVVSNAFGAVTSASATLTVNSAPEIVAQPVDQTVAAGQTATFNVTAIGTEPISYQWRRNGVAIEGATDDSYTTPEAVFDDNGATYSVAISNAFGAVTSAGANLTVTSAPEIAAQPTNLTVLAGQSAVFSVTAIGTAPLNYQWRKNGAVIDDATDAGYTNAVTVFDDNGATYSVAISNDFGYVESASATLTVNSAPVIVAQPVDQTVAAGQTATFSVTANGTDPLSYQWRKNGSAIDGATTATYTTPVTLLDDNGAVYSVAISNAFGAVTSAEATLTVNSAPVIAEQPTNLTVMAGQSAAFSVTANGTDPLSYQWRKHGVNIPGATTAVYATPVTLFDDNGAVYSVEVSNAFGAVTSAEATLTVNSAPVIASQPVSQTVLADQAAAFSVTAIGTEPLSYQWRKNGVNITDATAATYTIPVAVFGDNGAVYSVAMSNAFGGVTSAGATLTVNSAPEIAVQPVNQTVLAGQTATFSVTANGTAPLNYQWFKNGTNIAGATAATYTTPATVFGDNGAVYSVTMLNAFGSATSAEAILTVNSAPAITDQPANQTVMAGLTATFSVTANGTAPLAYQWRKNGTNIAGATAANYTTPATVLGDDGTAYGVVVTNALGSVTSANAILTVSSAPAITVQPANQTVAAGQTATFGVTVSGAEPMTHQWRRNGTNIVGATAANYTTPATVFGDNGAAFSVVVTNVVGSVTSVNATLTVNSAPMIVTQPTNQTVREGQAAAFSVTANGTEPMSYQWRKNGENIAGAIAANYATPAAVLGDNGVTYSVVVMNAFGEVTSAGATLTVSSGGGASNLINVAAQVNGGVASASSVYSADYPPAAVNNGDRKGLIWGSGGGWADATYNARPDWLQIDFASVCSISEIDVFTLQNNYANPVEPTPTQTFVSYGVTAFDVQYWDGAAWITAPGGSVTNNNLIWRKITFPAVTTDRIRVLINNSTFYYSCIVEVEAYASTLPMITTQPANQTVTVGQTAAFGVTATGAAPLTYQWRKNGAAISGATAALYTTPALVAGDNGAAYSVVVSNAFGGVTSVNATLIVNVPDPDLAAHWTLDETSGLEAADSSGNGHLGIACGATWTTSGKFGGALQFAGAEDVLVSTQAVSLGENWTISSWFTTPLPDTATWHALTRGQSFDHQIITDAGLNLGVYIQNPWSGFRGCGYNLGGLSNGWHHVAAVGSGTTTTFYVDGAWVGVSDRKSTTEVYTVGNYIWGNQRFADKLDDVRVYKRALTAPEVEVLVAGQTLSAWWRFDETNGTAAADSSGNGHTGLVYNAKWTTPGKIGGALQFTNAGDRVTISRPVSLGENWTISSWFTAPLPNTATYHTLTRGQSFDHQIITDAGLNLGVYISSPWSGFRSCGYNLGGLSAGWHHVAAVGSGTTTTFYVDGAWVGVSDRKSTTDVYAVGNYQSGGQRFAEKLDDVRVYNLALTAAEVLAIVPRLPEITVQPADQQVMACQTATFSVTATGTVPLRYQWRRNGADLPGATMSAYTTPATLLTDNGAIYSVVAMNALGNVTSVNATLTVNTPDPDLAAYWKFDETNGTAAADSSGNGHMGLVYNAKWTTPGKIDGALQFTNAGDRVTISYPVSLGENWTISSWFTTPLPDTATYHTLTRGQSFDHQIITDAGLNLGVYITSPWSGFRGCGYNLGGLSNGWHHVAAVGSGTTTTFYVDGVWVGVSDRKSTTDVYAVGNYQSGGQRFAEKLDDVRIYKRALTAAEVLAIVPRLPEITLQPVSKTVAVGQPAAFSVTATGSAPLAYQWRKNGVNITGATAAGYTNPATAADDSGAMYSVVVTNALGAVTSANAILTVNCPPNAPSGLTAIAAKSSLVDLAWTDNANDETVYVVQRRIGPTNAFVFLAYAASNATNYADSTVVPVTFYTYRVFARNAYGDSPVAEASATTPSNAPPMVLLTGPANGAAYAAPASIALTADASDSDGGVARVEFYNGAVKLGQATTAPYSFTWNNAAAGDYSLTARAYDNRYAVTTSSVVTVHVTVGGGALPAGWSTAETANVGIPGATSYADGQFNISASGLGIGGTSDSFYFDYQSLSGDSQIIARVTSLQNTGAGVKAGVMMRTSLASNAPCMFAGLTPSIAMFSRRIATNGVTTANSGAAASAPYWVKLVRYGNSVSGFGSSDGANWVLLGTEIFTGLPDTLYVGLAVTSGNNGMLATATFDNVTLGAPPAENLPTVTLNSPQAGTTNTAPGSVALTADATADAGGQIIRAEFYRNGVLIGLDQSVPFAIAQENLAVGSYIYRARVTDDLGATIESAPITVTVAADYGGALPSGLAWQDVGPASIAGRAGYSDSDGKYTIGSSGRWLVGSGAFGFAWTSWAGDGQIVARATSMQGGLAGVMVRDGLASNACHALMAVYYLNLSWTTYFYQRANAGDVTTGVYGGGVTTPYWVKLVRYGNSVSGFRSADGINWVFGGTAILALPSDMNVGLAVSSFSDALTEATFDNVSMTAPPANSLPTASLSSPQSGVTNPAPASVTLNAVAADSDGTVRQVAFYQDGVLAVNDTVAPYSTTLNNVGVGAHEYTARVTDDLGATVASAPLTIQVVP
ncbi:MAG: Ig-like domain-containing protein [Kiritimatiellia bacterium]